MEADLNQAVNISIGNIDEELKHLWEVDLARKQLKACLFNLVIFAPDERRANYLKLVVQSIIEKFPCRLQFIYCDEDTNKSYLKVETSIVETKTGGQSIACDQISFCCSKNLLERVPYLVIPHLVPDLPIYLLWGQNPIDEKTVLPDLLKYATRLIFDSECLGTIKCTNSVLLEKMQHLKLEIMDMNWALTSNWRSVFCQIFDSSEKIEQLKQTKTLTLAYNEYQSEGLQHAEIRAHYIQAWLAAQLGWEFQSVLALIPGDEIIYQGEKGPITVQLVPRNHPDLPPGSILSIEIVSYDQHLTLISRKAKHSVVMVYCSSSEQCELPYALPLSNTHRGFAFLREIFYNKMGNQYHNMVQVFSKISTQLQAQKQ